MSSAKLFLLIATVNGFCAVGLGAFGSHGLRSRTSEALLGAWHTAVQYHFYHVLALMLVAVLLGRDTSSGVMTISGWLFVAGILLFCGSLYGLALGGPWWLGPITPVGGLCFLAAWLSLSFAVLRGS